MPKKVYDVIVVGTGAGGGTAIKALAEAGLSVLALNAGRKLVPAKDFRNHRQPYDMKFRGFGDPRTRAQSYGYMDNEYVAGVWEHEITYTTAPGTQWMWPRCYAVGGKTNFWGRSSARFGDIDFKAAQRDGYDVDWPVSYEEIAPYYTRAEQMVGVASTVQHRPSNPDGHYLPPMNFRCLDYILQSGCREERRSLSARPHRATDGGARRPPRLPLLRQLHGGLRRRGVFLLALVLPAAGGEDRKAGDAHQRAGPGSAGG